MLFPEANLEAAAYVFESSHGNNLSRMERERVEEADLAQVSPDLIAEQIWRTLQAEDLEPAYRSKAYWALGKLGRREDKRRFTAALQTEVDRDIRVAYQVMIALDNLGESVFSRSGVASHEDDLNRIDAIAYLSNET